MVRPVPWLRAHFRSRQRKNPNFVFAKVNTEEQQAIAAAFNIRSIPTLMIFRDQIVIFSEAGAPPASSSNRRWRWTWMGCAGKSPSKRRQAEFMATTRFNAPQGMPMPSRLEPI